MLRTSFCLLEQNEKKFRITLKDGRRKVCFRIPQYAKDFGLWMNSRQIPFQTENGYAVIVLDEGTTELTVSFGWKLAEICINPKVEENRNKVCVMYGPYLMCAEGIDNQYDLSFTIAENPHYTIEKDQIKLLTAANSEATLIPYYKRNNRFDDNPLASAMAVWFPRESMKNTAEIQALTGNQLYGYYALY